MKTAIALAALLASASTAAAQRPTIVHTNISDDGQRMDRIVTVVRESKPAAPVPPSIVTTQVLPANYKRPLGPSGYVPPQRSNWGETRVTRPTPVVQPWFVNGIRVGDSPSGNWMATSVGRPIVDVRIINDRRTR